MLTAAELDRRRRAVRRVTIQDSISEARAERDKDELKRKAIAASRNRTKINGMFQDEMIRRKSINSCIIRSTGEPKKQMTMDEAIAASVYMRNRHGGLFYHYKCVHCEHWHVGKRKPKE